MAPLTVDDVCSQKRNSTTANFHLPPTKKQHLRHGRHHKLTWRPDETIRRQLPAQDEESVQTLLRRSIALVLEAVGFQGADPVAIESFRAETEEYMLHLLANVRQSMLACRRTQAIPQDFLQSLHLHQLSLISLLPHLDPPVPPSISQPLLSREDAAPALQHQQLPMLDFASNNRPRTGKSTYIPKSFPYFPSEHTYKATPNVPVRENNPKKMRERAIEEGRLGEAALRKLVSVRTDDAAHPDPHDKWKSKSMRTIRAEVWREAMEDSTPAAATSASRDMDIDGNFDQHGMVGPVGRYGPPVNAERRYWRKPGTSPASRLTQGV